MNIAKIYADVKSQVKSDSLLDLAEYLINYYFENCYESEEHVFILRKKMLLVCLDLMEWLSANNVEVDSISSFSFEKSLTKANQKLYEYKKKLYFYWINETIKELLKKRLSKESLSCKDREYIEFLVNCPKFKAENINFFKKQIGLK